MCLIETICVYWTDWCSYVWWSCVLCLCVCLIETICVYWTDWRSYVWWSFALWHCSLIRFISVWSCGFFFTCKDFGGSFNYSFPSCTFFIIIISFFLFSGDHFYSLARIRPQWLSELRWLWTSIPWQVACELIWLIGSHMMPWRHSDRFPHCAWTV